MSRLSKSQESKKYKLKRLYLLFLAKLTYNAFHLNVTTVCIIKNYKLEYYRSLLDSTQVSFARNGKKRPVVFQVFDFYDFDNRDISSGNGYIQNQLQIFYMLLFNCQHQKSCPLPRIYAAVMMMLACSSEGGVDGLAVTTRMPPIVSNAGSVSLTWLAWSTMARAFALA